jgi:uracil-DNA glycosylase
MKTQIESSWANALSEEFEKPYFSRLNEEVKNAYSEDEIWPKKDQIFTAFSKCPFNKVRLVILGQDPYPTPGHAHGLCFSVQEDVNPFPKSLNNIFKEIETDLGISPPPDGNLNRWAEQGVLLLNTILTVKAHKANSHKDFGWETFTNAVISKINIDLKGVIFILWGSQAQKKIDRIDQERHHVLKSVHPSPLSAYRGFFGCKHFSKANELLISHDHQPINW